MFGGASGVSEFVGREGDLVDYASHRLGASLKTKNKEKILTFIDVASKSLRTVSGRRIIGSVSNCTVHTMCI